MVAGRSEKRKRHMGWCSNEFRRRVNRVEADKKFKDLHYHNH